MPDHRWVQPTFVPRTMTHIHMTCPCGYTTPPVRPEHPGALATIKANYANHLARHTTDTADLLPQPNQSTDSYGRTDGLTESL